MNKNLKTLAFIDSHSVRQNPEKYLEVRVDVRGVLESWRVSLFSFEWLDAEGKIKDLSALSDTEQAKRRSVEDCIQSGERLEKPILGIGLQDNIEIGRGRAEFLTLAALGALVIPVHILKGDESDFKAFLAGV